MEIIGSCYYKLQIIFLSFSRFPMHPTSPRYRTPRPPPPQLNNSRGRGHGGSCQPMGGQRLPGPGSLATSVISESSGLQSNQDSLVVDAKRKVGAYPRPEILNEFFACSKIPDPTPASFSFVFGRSGHQRNFILFAFCKKNIDMFRRQTNNFLIVGEIVPCSSFQQL